ncbi:hypothetical protein JTB14_013660 [Gonioctena quinquepunctata]|nr:hypothetical protein JTB14_013660 [Gonioctena quinquepunctata]
MADEARLSADEYEKQYFGFSSTEFIEDYREQVKKSIKKSLTDVYNEMTKEMGAKDLSIEKFQKLYDAYLESIKNPLENFEKEARKIFEIPKNVLLDMDTLRHTEYSDEDIARLEKEIADLKRQRMQEKLFLAKCKQIKEMIDTSITPIYNKINGLLTSTKRANKRADEFNEDKQKKLIENINEYIQRYLHNDEDAYDEDFRVMSTEFVLKDGH